MHRGNMKNILYILCILISFSTQAVDIKTISNRAKSYSELIACQLEDELGSKSIQYKTIKIKDDDSDVGGTGALYMTFWHGDIGCEGGNGTVTPNFTIFEHRGFASVLPVVVNDYKFPFLDLVYVDRFDYKNGIIFISGLTYGRNDHQHQPTQRMNYKLSLPKNSFTREFILLK